VALDQRGPLRRPAAYSGLLHRCPADGLRPSLSSITRSRRRQRRSNGDDPRGYGDVGHLHRLRSADVGVSPHRLLHAAIVRRSSRAGCIDIRIDGRLSGQLRSVGYRLRRVLRRREANACRRPRLAAGPTVFRQHDRQHQRTDDLHRGAS